MNSLQIALFILVIGVLANLPFVLSAPWVWIARRIQPTLFSRLVFSVILYCAAGGLAMALERYFHGSVYPQDWAFYVITFAFYWVLAFPGFVYRYLRRDKDGTGTASQTIA